MRHQQITQGIQISGQNASLEMNFLAILFVNTHKNIIFVHIETTHISQLFYSTGV